MAMGIEFLEMSAADRRVVEGMFAHAEAARQLMQQLPDLKNIGGCEIVREIGRGGMATVYLGKDAKKGHAAVGPVGPGRAALRPRGGDPEESGSSGNCF